MNGKSLSIEPNMLIDPKSNLFGAIQNVADGLNLDAFVKNITDNMKATQSVLRSVDFMQTASGSMNFVAGSAPVAGYGDLPPVDMGAQFYEAAGSILQSVGKEIGKSFDNAFPDLKNDGKMETYTPDGLKTKEESNVYVLNGVDMDEAKRAGQAKDTSKMLGKNVNMIHNATAGLPLDAVEYVKETFLGIPSPASQKLSDEMYKKLTSNPPQKVEVIAYSQGSMQATQALSLTVARLKKDGMSDEEIRGRMSTYVDVTFVGTPVDPNNPLQLSWNVPPGVPNGQHRLDWYFKTEDVVLHGKNPPSSQTITKNGPPGETNFRMIRHEKDPVATWVHDTGPGDLALLATAATMGPFAFMNPFFVPYAGYRAAVIVGELGLNVAEKGDPFGYHDYSNYYGYLQSDLAKEA
jgi:hypothetical protein